MNQAIVKQGDTFRKKLVLTDKSGNVVGLTGAAAYSDMRSEPGDDLLCSAVTAIDTATGTITVTYSADQMAALEPGEYGYDVRISVDNDVFTLYTERVKVVLPYTELE